LRAGLELSSVDGDTLAHPDEAVAGAPPVAVRATVVRHAHLDLTVAVPHAHLRARRARVFERIRQAFLDDAVRGEVDARG
jgi:hypothetical protein